MNVAQYKGAASYISRKVSGKRQRSEKTAWFFIPVIAPILQSQLTVRIMSVIAMLQLLVTMSGVQGWRCPVYSTVNIPCPGCGLSTATVYLIRGEWRTAFSTHAFAPLFVISIAIMVILSFLPRRSYEAAVQRLAVMEAKTGMTGLLLLGFIGYWGFKFIF